MSQSSTCPAISQVLRDIEYAHPLYPTRREFIVSLALVRCGQTMLQTAVIACDDAGIHFDGAESSFFFFFMVGKCPQLI